MKTNAELNKEHRDNCRAWKRACEMGTHEEFLNKACDELSKIGEEMRRASREECDGGQQLS